jgi:hypothetical protein
VAVPGAPGVVVDSASVVFVVVVVVSGPCGVVSGATVVVDSCGVVVAAVVVTSVDVDSDDAVVVDASVDFVAPVLVITPAAGSCGIKREAKKKMCFFACRLFISNIIPISDKKSRSSRIFCTEKKIIKLQIKNIDYKLTSGAQFTEKG